MGLNSVKTVLLQGLVLSFHAITTSAQHPIKQYLHITGVGPHSQAAGLATLPTVGLVRQPTVVPSAGLGGLSALALPGLISALASSAVAQAPCSGVPTLKTQPTQLTPRVPTTKPNSPATNTPSGGLDSNVLNNLAIALQLLILSNILNSPLPENDVNPVYEMLQTVKNIPVPLPPMQRNNYPSLPPMQNSNCYPSQSMSEYQNMPNANFVGNTGFLDQGMTDPYVKSQNTRTSFQLMSPYEALGPNSPFSDPILSSPYGSVISSKKDFQSPYSMIQDSDMFSMGDMF